MNNAPSQTALLGIGGIMGFHLRLLTAKLLGRNWPSIAPWLQAGPWRQDALSWVISEAPGKMTGNRAGSPCSGSEGPEPQGLI